MRPIRRAVFFAAFLASVACGIASSPARQAVADSRSADAAALLDAPLFDDDGSNPETLAKAIARNYTKYEYRIAMRDGARLYTIAYVPRDRSRVYPILLDRTPYSVSYGVDNYPPAADMRRFAPAWQFVRDGYIFAHQDVRGRLMSEGTFVDMRPHASKGGVDEATDAFDTIDFLVKNVPANSGKVGVWGISYPGFYAAQAAIDAHPALKAVSPQAPVTDWFIGDDFHHNGALFLEGSFEFEASFGKVRPEPTKKFKFEPLIEADDAYDFFLACGTLANCDAKYLHGSIPFWNDVMTHPTRDDFWRSRDPRPYYKDVKPAILTVGGWFDAEDLWGTLETYKAFKHQNPKNEVSLVMGPWRHGGWARSDGDALGDVSFGTKTSLFFREQIEKPFFDHHLKGKPWPASPAGLPSPIWAFETGTNVWERYAVWPPREARSADLFFHAGGKLGSVPVKGPEDEQGFDAWVSDPNKPVPYIGPHAGDDEDYMVGDERDMSRRPDVMVYETEPLKEDVTLSGPIAATLWVSTTGTDADFIVKVVDVHPQDHADPEPNPTRVRMGGFQQLVRGEIMRGKFRDSLERPEPFKPREPTLVKFSLPDVNHTFRASHRILVAVQSSWFPLVDRNPQTFVDIYKATPADFRPATHHVYRTVDHPSSIRVTLLRGALPAL
jgi:putative CocE/NonD family hydrolase